MALAVIKDFADKWKTQVVFNKYSIIGIVTIIVDKRRETGYNFY